MRPKISELRETHCILRAICVSERNTRPSSRATSVRDRLRETQVNFRELVESLLRWNVFVLRCPSCCETCVFVCVRVCAMFAKE